MADFSREKAVAFWFHFDQTFFFSRPPEVRAAFPIAYPDGDLNGLADLVKGSLGDADIAAKVGTRSSGFTDLANIQLQIMQQHFPDAEDLRRGFEDFGQGVLFDNVNARPPGRRIHMMDGTPEDWVGYHRWYAFARTAIAIGTEPESWSLIARFIALAWAIQSEAEPVMDQPDNPGLPPDRLDVLRAAWLGATSHAVHKAFLSYTGLFQSPNHIGQVRAPAPELLEQQEPEGLVFSDVRNILEAAAGPGNPIHSGEGRFWNLLLADFKTAVIYGEPLIADEGDQQGARSALVRVLRGTLDGFPQMPLNRPALPAAQIDAIEGWIDAGCPE